jgi:hypothetical protein
LKQVVIGLVLFGMSAWAGKPLPPPSHAAPKDPPKAAEPKRPEAPKTAVEALLTDPLGNLSSIAIVLERPGLIFETVPQGFDLFDFEKVGPNEYKAKVRVSTAGIAAKPKEIRIKRDPLLANYWNFDVDGWYFNVPFTGPVMNKPKAFLGLPIFGNKQKVTHHIALPKL